MSEEWVDEPFSNLINFAERPHGLGVHTLQGVWDEYQRLGPVLRAAMLKFGDFYKRPDGSEAFHASSRKIQVAINTDALAAVASGA